ncbi:MAG: cystathionine gamma-synthase family protein [Saprospiraceae bacterium]|jgi:methionine-gamma-lyase|nr:cystathionine gamma-synthase family protein [Saprospiraceae bacterium]MBX7179124.1 cystathionine gamma-synthase family protein [Saprospiraceae bacterium]MCB0589899.1 cystathionine gamma-synthase family protein [Saprospiraceae bacterium]MCO5283355.1 cystathionine gamma-synthase family protein [Saprospiraceae bacterium]MCO6470092.1 cystathionine gamma-synthase family protein [Saprospiraceae bacterium]
MSKELKRKMKPESLMMSYGYKPELSEGAVKCPIFQTSTFVFKNAEEGKAFFEVAYGHRNPNEGEELGLIYSRINNPDLEILENRLTLWDEAEDCAVFESGMSAITTVLLEFLKPGDLLLISSPLYGGSDHFIRKILPKFGIHVAEFRPGQSKSEILRIVDQSGHASNLALVYIETPANPTNDMVDINLSRQVADHFQEKYGSKVFLAVDNTYMGPLWQHPLKHGADLVLYSATKYIGGHSDVIAGACLGSFELIKRVKGLRTFLGNMASPNTGWLLLRSLETLKARMDIQSFNANKVAQYLNGHPMIEKVYFPGNLTEADGEQFEIKSRQCMTNGGMISFDIKGGEKEAFKFLNALDLIKLAVSLGSTESLAEHPATMTHVDVDPKLRRELFITEKMIRLSIGVENYEDIIYDIGQALEQAKS